MFSSPYLPIEPHNDTYFDTDEYSSSCFSTNKWTIEYLHRFMFHPSVCDTPDDTMSLGPYHFIQPNMDQAAIARRSHMKETRCLIISHGNAGNIFNRVGLLDRLSHYPGDIYCYEYDGFGPLGHKPVSIQNCRENHLFWLKYLKQHGYKHIDLWGESIGGGIVMETLDYLQDNDTLSTGFLAQSGATAFSLNSRLISGSLEQSSIRPSLVGSELSVDGTSSLQDGLVMPLIKQVYLQSTFSSIKNLLANIGSVLYYFYLALFLNDLDTQSVLAKFRGSPIMFHILHSRVDEVIPYLEAQTNYTTCIKNRVSVKLWNIGGTHNQVIGLDAIVF